MAGTRMSVAVVARLLRAGGDASEIVAAYPHLAPAAVSDAISYDLDHRDEVDGAIDASSLEAVVSRHGLTVDGGRVVVPPR